MRFLSILAEPLESGYRSLAQQLGCSWNEEPDWRVRQQQLVDGQTELASLCGLLFTLLRNQGLPINPLACAILDHPRYQKPRYFVEVVAREAFRFEELEGKVMAVNDWDSLSGYHALRAHLHKQNLTASWFGELKQTGSHRRSLDAVRAREVDFACLDSTFWDFLPDKERRDIEVCLTLGPFPAPLLAYVGDSQPELEWESVSAQPPFKRLEPVGLTDYEPIARLWAASQSLV